MTINQEEKPELYFYSQMEPEDELPKQGWKHASVLYPLFLIPSCPFDFLSHHPTPARV